MISCQEEGILTQDPNANAQPRSIRKSFKLSVTNETRTEKTLTVQWEIRNAAAQILKSTSVMITVNALSSVWFPELEIPELNENDEYLSFRAIENGELLSEGTAIFSLPRYFHFIEPNLRASVDGDTISIESDSYAKSVEIQNENQDMILSDNYFDMNAGKKTVNIISGKAEGLKLRSVFNIQ
jgi:beta-mannosidase